MRVAARGIGRQKLRRALHRIHMSPRSSSTNDTYVARVGVELFSRDDQLFGEHAAQQLCPRDIGHSLVDLPAVQ